MTLLTEVSDFEKYIDLRVQIRDSHYLQWELLNDKILSLIEQTNDVTPEIIEDIRIAYDGLADGIIPTMFPVNFPIPKNFKELRQIETPLLEYIPESIRKLFNDLFRAYLKNSINNQLIPDETLYNLLTKFNNENAELRYPVPRSNPYLSPQYRRTNSSNYDWRKKATDEFYPHYDGVLTLLSSMRNFQTHKRDAFTSSKFELAKRKIVEPISGLDNPGNYVVLSNLVILSVYAFIEILQIWIDTQVRIGNIN